MKPRRSSTTLVAAIALAVASMTFGGPSRASSVHAATTPACPMNYVCAYTGKGETGQVFKVYVGPHLQAGKCYDIETGQFIDSLDNETGDTVVLKEGSCAHPGPPHTEDSTPRHTKTDEKTPIDARSERLGRRRDPRWGAGIRTQECRIQSPVPYHLATPHRARACYVATAAGAIEASG
jgi:hypothetical protein